MSDDKSSKEIDAGKNAAVYEAMNLVDQTIEAAQAAARAQIALEAARREVDRADADLKYKLAKLRGLAAGGAIRDYEAKERMSDGK